MKRFEGQDKAAWTLDQMVTSLVTHSHDVVTGACDTLRDLNYQEYAESSRVKTELACFFFFAIEYCWQEFRASSEQEHRAFGQELSNQLRILFGEDSQGPNMLRLRERLTGYGEVVNTNQSASARLWALGKRLMEFCGWPRDPFLATLAPYLLQRAKESVIALPARRQT